MDLVIYFKKGWRAFDRISRDAKKAQQRRRNKIM